MERDMERSFGFLLLNMMRWLEEQTVAWVNHLDRLLDWLEDFLQ